MNRSTAAKMSLSLLRLHFDSNDLMYRVELG